MGGGDKALRLLGGQTLLAHVLARLDPSGALRAARQVALSANGAASRFAAFGLPVLADRAGSGPLAGILAGMAWAAGAGLQTLLSVPADCPFLPLDLADRLAAARTSIACATSGGQVHHADGALVGRSADGARGGVGAGRPARADLRRRPSRHRHLPSGRCRRTPRRPFPQPQHPSRPAVGRGAAGGLEGYSAAGGAAGNGGLAAGRSVSRGALRLPILVPPVGASRAAAGRA